MLIVSLSSSRQSISGIRDESGKSIIPVVLNIASGTEYIVTGSEIGIKEGIALHGDYLVQSSQGNTHKQHSKQKCVLQKKR